MKKFYIIFFGLCTQCVPLVAQVRLLNKVSGEPVPYASVLSKGKVIAESDKQGYLPSSVMNDRTVSIQHLSYQTLDTVLTQQSKTLFLSPLSYTLKEVNVNPSSEDDYIKLTGLYRSYELDNNLIKYYTDGIVEYYIPCKSAKKTRYRLLQWRSFYNKRLEDPKAFIKVVGVSAPGVPTLENPLHDDLRLNGDSVQKGDNVVGFIRNDSVQQAYFIYIDKLAPLKEQKFSFFGNKICFKKLNYAAVYNDKACTWMNLKNMKAYNKVEIQKKKRTPVTIESNYEFHVTDIQYVSPKDIKKLKLEKDYSFPKSHSYTAPYWNNTADLPQNSAYIDSALNGMVMY